MLKRFFWLVLALLLPLGLDGASAAGLPVAKKTIIVKSRDSDISVQYPQTGNTAIDAALLDYARKSVAQFKTFKPDFADNDHQYQLATTYVVERNDGKMFGVVFTEYSDTGGAHPNSDYRTFNFLLPDGAQVFLPEIVDGERGLKRIAELATADLIANIASGPEPASDADSIKMGTAPAADNFKDFIWLPGKLHLYFPAYQVASYAAGPQEAAIALVRLRDVIRPDWRAPAPSFDCKKAAADIEKAICADAALARLDRQVAETYQTVIRNAYEPAAQEKVRQTQRDWVARRNRTCGGTGDIGSCLTKLYRNRLAALNKPAE
ncbi:MAG TPA: lysozyme inhibitor LprI family protein [Rhizomicrobium sp.]